MAEIYKFFNAVETSPGVFDREYQESDFADYFGSMLSTGLLHTDNIPGMSVSVETGTLNTTVNPGKAIMKGHLYENTLPLTLVHSIPEAALNRIDRIVLRIDSRNQSRFIKLFVKEGDPSSTPLAPVLQRDNFIYEISLAQILVRANTVQLLQSDLVDERLDENLGGLVYSLISIPTSQFQAEWDAFMAGIQDSGFATTQSVTDLQTEVTTHKADDVRHVTAEIAKFKRGSSSFTDNDTSQTFTDSFITVDSLITISITSVTPPQGVWVVNSGAGNFTITSTVAESADITFDYYIQKAVG